jgi:hypothetical protein
MIFLFSYSISHFLVFVFIPRNMPKFVVNLAKIAHIKGIITTKVLPTNNGKLGDKVKTLKKPKTKGDYGISPTNKPSFVASLYVAIPHLGDGGMMTHKHFAKDYNLKCESLSQNK